MEQTSNEESEAESGIGHTHSSSSDDDNKSSTKHKQKLKLKLIKKNKEDTTTSIDRLADSIRNAALTTHPVAQKGDHLQLLYN